MEHRQGRWSRRQDNDPTRNRLLSINGSKENGTVHKPILSRQKSERSRSVEHFGENIPLGAAVTSAPPAVSILASPPAHRQQPVAQQFTKSEVSSAPEIDVDEEPLGARSRPGSPDRVNSPTEPKRAEDSDTDVPAPETTADPDPQPDDAVPEFDPEPDSDEPTTQERADEQRPDTPAPPLVAEESDDPVPEIDSDKDFQEEPVETETSTVVNHEPEPPSALNNTDGKSLGSIGSEFDSVDSGNHTYSTDADTIIEKPIEMPKRKIARPVELRMRQKRAMTGNESKIPDNNIYPENLSPFAQPKEGLAKTLLQLENPEWEVIMQGLQGLVRVGRHHAKMLQPMSVLHPAVVLLTRHIRNLRSQVARAACQAAQHLFVILQRALDPEVEDLAGALLSRMADANKFLRTDAMNALDSMVRNVSPIKSVSALVNKGAKHQNALVRGATSRLLLVVCSRLGPERTLSLPRETRDSLLITGAKMLQEGSLETRRYAKEMFTLLSADPRLHSIMANVIPSNIMRSISKVMARINTK